MATKSQSQNEYNLKNLSLLDHQCAYLLPRLMFSFVLCIYMTASKNFPVCDRSLPLSEYVKLVSFGCVTCFTTFSAVQITQMLYFSKGMSTSNSSSFIKINCSNLFVCFVAASSNYLAFARHLGGICSDKFG
jgi:hypothetical protein